MFMMKQGTRARIRLASETKLQGLASKTTPTTPRGSHQMLAVQPDAAHSPLPYPSLEAMLTPPRGSVRSRTAGGSCMCCVYAT